MRKRIVELASSSYYLLDDTFNRITLTERFVAEVHAKFEQAGMQSGRAIIEKFGVIDDVFLAQYTETSSVLHENPSSN